MFTILIFHAKQGQEIIIARAVRPVVRLVSIIDEHANRTPGSAKEIIVVINDFDSTLPENVLAEFYS